MEGDKDDDEEEEEEEEEEKTRRGWVEPVEEGDVVVVEDWPGLTEMFDRKAFPRPAPSAAPLTRPAISTTSRKAGTWLLGLLRSHSQVKRSSGMLTRAYRLWCRVEGMGTRDRGGGWGAFDEVAGVRRGGWRGGSVGRHLGLGPCGTDLVGLDGAEREVLRGDGALCQRVEEGALADVGQTDDADLEPGHSGKGVSDAAYAQGQGRDGLCLLREGDGTKQRRYTPFLCCKACVLDGMGDRGAVIPGSGCRCLHSRVSETGKVPEWGAGAVRPDDRCCAIGSG